MSNVQNCDGPATATKHLVCIALIQPVFLLGSVQRTALLLSCLFLSQADIYLIGTREGRSTLIARRYKYVCIRIQRRVTICKERLGFKILTNENLHFFHTDSRIDAVKHLVLIVLHLRPADGSFFKNYQFFTSHKCDIIIKNMRVFKGKVVSKFQTNRERTFRDLRFWTNDHLHFYLQNMFL